MNATDIKKILKHKYGTNEATAIAFEVSHGTGRHANRRVDAVVMDLWPSRGLTLHAMEIKTSVSDLKRELAMGSKAEEIAQHCDFFSLVVPKGLITDNRMNDIPKAWGVMEIMSDNVIKFRREAKKTKARPMDREFCAALLRGVGKALGTSIQIVQDTAINHVEEQIKRRVDQRLEGIAPDAKRWQQFKEAIGDINYAGDEALLEAIRFVVRSGIESSYNGIRTLGVNLAEMAARIEMAADTVKLKKLERRKI